MISIAHKISIFTHDMDGTTSATAGLIEYLLNKKIQSLIVCKFPFRISSDGSIKIKSYIEGRLVSEKKSPVRFFKPELISYIKDLICGSFYGIKYCKNFDIFIGTPNLLVLIGIFLRRLGLVKKVIYYQIDYTPVRYQNRLVNKLYYSIDKYVCYNSDEVWSLTKQMILCKAKDNGWNVDKIKYRIVPTGNSFSNLNQNQTKRKLNNNVIYFGGIYRNKGSDLLVPIALSLIKKKFTDFKIECIGGGEIDALKREIKRYHLTRHFHIHGQIEDMKKIQTIMQRGAIAIAPYYPEDTNNFSYYSDPGKVKNYLGCGLPVVITDVPPVAKDLIKKEKIGAISDYDPDHFAEAIIKLLSNKNTLSRLQSKVVKIGKEYSWENIFNKVFKKENKP